MPDLNLNLLGSSLSNYFIDYTKPKQKPVIDPETQRPVIENGEEKTENELRDGQPIYETPLSTLSVDDFNRSLGHFKVPSDPDGVRSHLFETLDLDGNGALTQEEMGRAVQILIDLAGKTGMTQGLSVVDWNALKGSDGALEFAFKGTFGGATLLELCRKTGDTSNTKAYFQITKSEFNHLMVRLGLFNGWDPEKGLLQHRKHAIDYLWGLYKTGDGSEAVIKCSTDLARSISKAVEDKVSSTSRFPRYQSFFEQHRVGLYDANLTVEELEGVCRAFLGWTLDIFLMQFYRDQQRTYDRVSQAIKESNR